MFAVSAAVVWVRVMVRVVAFFILFLFEHDLDPASLICLVEVPSSLCVAVTQAVQLSDAHALCHLRPTKSVFGHLPALLHSLTRRNPACQRGGREIFPRDSLLEVLAGDAEFQQALDSVCQRLVRGGGEARQRAGRAP
jgi:hypothetical protein